jgi:murein L,D-transpeptidase YafK
MTSVPRLFYMSGLTAAKSCVADVHRGGMVYSLGMLAGRLSRKPRVRVLLVAIGLFLLASADSIHALPPASSGQQQDKADSILILKKDHTMELLAGGKVIRTYKVALGQGGLAPKQREGDARTPEGHYVIDSKNEHSKYHKALHVSYPSTEDRKRAARLGVSPGGAIMIHGLPDGKAWVGARHRLFDWTLGCIAVRNDEIDEVWSLVPVGTPVEIRP